jgi:hypothetical protein
MKIANRCIALAMLSLASLAVFASPQSAIAEEQEGFLNLLPGNELEKHWSTKGNWKVNDEGAVTLTPRDGESGWSRWDSYLWLGGEYDDFEMSFDYMVQKGGNSGFYFNVGDKNDPVAKGIEVQIYDSGNKPADAKLTDHDSGGIIPGIPPAKNAAKPFGEWNHFDIAVKGDQLTVKLNGEVVNQVDLSKNQALASRPKKGFIGFQDHALPISLRNLKIKAQ